MTLAVIFVSTLASPDPAYEAMAESMQRLKQEQPGYLGVDSVRHPVSGEGVTVSYWSDDASARAWKQLVEHLEAQRLGRTNWYSRYRVSVAEVTRTYWRPQ